MRFRTMTFFLSVCLGTVLFGGLAPCTVALGGTTELVSVARDGTQAYSSSFSPMLSADGRFVAFGSNASNLVLNDTNSRRDVFVYDRLTGVTERVSVASDGTEANAESLGGFESPSSSISADGRFVAFVSYATNLVQPDANNKLTDVFVHDRQTSVTERVSVASDGTQGNHWSDWGSLSADGRFVVFLSYATNLVPDDTNNETDVFVHDRQTGVTERVSIASDGTEANGESYWDSISADGRFVAFASLASNLVPDDTNVQWDVFVHDRQTGVTERVSVASDVNPFGGGQRPSLSADGRFVAYQYGDVFVYDRQTGVTERVSVASDVNPFGGGQRPSLSADGRFVAYDSSPGVFVYDRQTGVTERVSVASDGTQGNNKSVWASLSADGQFVAFSSRASNLVPGDTNNSDDIFVHDRGPVPLAFYDVPLDHWAHDAVGALAASGITVGCGGGRYCPGDAVTRAQMAVFIERGLRETGYTPAAATGGVFDDVPVNHWAAAFIEEFFADGITSGCSVNPPLYCPGSPVTRAQMAIFLLRTKHGASYTPPAAMGTRFDDVAQDHWAAGWIEQLAEEGITVGCSASPPRYCPGDSVTRAQMAVFLQRVFNLPGP